jgi:diadenosine tetraphosphate (Ap4A) HIT family hydrolase
MRPKVPPRVLKNYLANSLNLSTDGEAGFSLDPRLAADCFFVSDLPLSRVLLMNDSRYPWLILVPRRSDAREIHHLATEDQSRLLSEISTVSYTLEKQFAPDKINVGALGNIVSQLHIHVIARHEGDPAWPGPVWGHSSAKPYVESVAIELARSIAANLV